MIRILAFLLAVLACAAAFAADVPERDPNSPAGKRAARLGTELRCLVCQNQTIEDSNAGLAVDLRRQIDEQIAAGRSDDEIRDYMVARYGDFVLYRPPLKATTVLLWLGPALLLLGGFWTLRRVLKARRAAGPPPELTPEESARARALLGGDAEKAQ